MRRVACDALNATAGTIDDELDAIYGEQSKPSADIPFSLEAAQCGEKVQWLCGDTWKDVDFIGVASHGHLIFQLNNDEIFKTVREYIRMAPKKMLKLKVQVIAWQNGVIDVCMIDDIEPMGDGAILLGDPIEIQVPDTRK